jgi:hypothetical protein
MPFEGLFIGGISAIFGEVPGCDSSSRSYVRHLAVCLALYKFKIVKVTEQFKSLW